MRFEIYKNYGVLGAEKKYVYTFKVPHLHGDFAERLSVELPMNEYFTLAEDKNGRLYVGNVKPCFYALDTGMVGHRVYLNVEEEETEC